MLQEAGGLLEGQGFVLLQYAVQYEPTPDPKFTQTNPLPHEPLVQVLPKFGTVGGPVQPEVSSWHLLHLRVPLTNPSVLQVLPFKSLPSQLSLPSILPSPQRAGVAGSPPAQMWSSPKLTQLSSLGQSLLPGVQDQPQMFLPLLVERMQPAPAGLVGHGLVSVHSLVQ